MRKERGLSADSSGLCREGAERGRGGRREGKRDGTCNHKHHTFSYSVIQSHVHSNTGYIYMYIHVRRFNIMYISTWIYTFVHYVPVYTLILHVHACGDPNDVHVPPRPHTHTHTCQSVGGKINFLEVAEGTDQVNICQPMLLPIIKQDTIIMYTCTYSYMCKNAMYMSMY